MKSQIAYARKRAKEKVGNRLTLVIPRIHPEIMLCSNNDTMVNRIDSVVVKQEQRCDLVGHRVAFAVLRVEIETSKHH